MKGPYKICQRFLLDAITHPPPLIAVVLSIFISVFAVGFWCAHWIDQVDLAVYRSLDVFTDNIKGENLLDKISGGLPIDVVYTWVNGSDPEILNGLQRLSSMNQDNSCPFSYCLPAAYISFIDDKRSKETLLELFPLALDMEKVTVTHNDALKNLTVVRLPSKDHISQAIGIAKQNFGNVSQPMQAFWTSDVGGGWGMKKRNAAIVTGGGDMTSEKLLSTLFPDQKDINTRCSVFGSSAVQLIECSEVEAIKELVDKSSDGVIKVRPAMLMLQQDKDDHRKEIDPNRFEDNEELRYSLRSLEKHAPWVRRVYIVTSGQIPYWINLDHPKLKVISHQDIFVNKNHLPTYSSPAIESHIHRIPGLSDHFLYFNDDVLLGSDVFPEDFYSPTGGYKIYLSWSLPECSSGCPGSWLNDGYCDRSCNTSACEWDGGDCAGDKEDSGMFDADDEFGSDMTMDFCAASCSDLWIADKFCDNACNVRDCGYDGGDCGVEELRLMHKIPIPTSLDFSYTIPKGIHGAWMNISSLLMGHKTITGKHTEHDGIRSLNVNTAQGILFLLFKSNVTTSLQIELQVLNNTSKEPISPGNTTTKYNITLKCDTSAEEDITKVMKVSTLRPRINAKNFTFQHITPVFIANNVLEMDDSMLMKYALVNANASNLPSDIAKAIMFYENLYSINEISLKALKRKKMLLISKSLQFNDSPELVFYDASEWPKNLLKNMSLNSHKLIADDTHPKNLSLRNLKINNNKNTSLDKSVLNISNNSTDVKSRQIRKVQNFSSRSLMIFHENLNQSAIENTTEFELMVDALISDMSGKKSHIGNDTLLNYEGNLPWERQRFFPPEGLKQRKTWEFQSSALRDGNRHLLDMFAESLLHVNRLYNSEFGYEARRVPAHMPHLINKDIMNDLQSRFKEEFDLTSSHKIRQANDMQFAFSYFFFMMNKKEIKSTAQVFHSFDTDNSGTLSDREIRTLLTRLYDLPLHYSTVQALHYVVKNCSTMYSVQPVPTPVYERYSDSDIPTVSLELALLCEPLKTLLGKLEKQNKYKYTQLSDDVVQFKMVSSNVSIVVHMLDEVRKNPRKFICLNSNLDPKSKDNELIHALVQDTYESLFPVPSTFELPLNYRNRFLYIKELQAWRRWRNFIRALIYACLASLIFLTIINFFSSELENLRRRWCRRRRRRDGFAGIRV